MRINLRHAATLQHLGLTDLAAVMQSRRGRCLRALKIRENWFLPGDPAAGRPGLYLKKHHVCNWWTRLRAWLGLGPGRTAGAVEAEQCRAMRHAGVPSMELVSQGERLSANGRLESFVITEELAGFTQLDIFLQQRFPPRPIDHARRRDPDLDCLLAQVARLVRRFHRAGYNHRDLYCCHLLVREPRPGQFELRLIDLQRVQRRRWFRRRWIVKDLGQLAYSAVRSHVGATERLRLMREYLGVRRLRSRDKRLIRQVLSRHQVMERRLGIQQARDISRPKPAAAPRLVASGQLVENRELAESAEQAESAERANSDIAAASGTSLPFNPPPPARAPQ